MHQIYALCVEAAEVTSGLDETLSIYLKKILKIYVVVY